MKRRELIRKAEIRLEALECLFSKAIRNGDFDSGRHWWQEYGGGLYMMETLGLLPLEEVQRRSSEMLDRLTAAMANKEAG